MSQPIISLIAAISENRALGKNNKLLWRLPEDLQRFKKLTSGHPVIMGRKTFESIGRPLPNRINIIVSRNKDLKINGCLVVSSVKEAIQLGKEKDGQEIFVIGGGQIYAEALPFADKLYLTIVKGNFAADTFFPDYSAFKKVVFISPPKTYQGYSYHFAELGR
ncbi:hypothetical protein A2160_05770 [Candidatus Beckwithbacteria bacterium RBG_13_42_9]|uniref:Dihydrofolate reductase n=1 Tax=Candidatus Beckwithbacteria bacterium RBG_13_42_9 TaxID=1797457 RepID=A0A1F5E665_9BACT|nr:MAG: hypothetical protein A2160_05770 [Candidatus Beckwithbacteria bacterium RBG_13_42_9]